MSDAQRSWERLGDEITRIGERFRDHYRQSGEDAGTDPGDDLRSAFDTLGKSLDRLFSSVGSALKDPAVQDEARRAANTLVGALGESVEEIGHSLRHLIEAERPAHEQGSWEPRSDGPTAVEPGLGPEAGADDGPDDTPGDTASP